MPQAKTVFRETVGLRVHAAQKKKYKRGVKLQNTKAKHKTRNNYTKQYRLPRVYITNA